jgi:hypothetical protein
LTDGAGGSLIGVDPLLGPLADNGGPATSSGQATFTYALLSGSPALDAGNDATCLSTDQRGVARPQGAQCDIGAFEKEQSNLSLAKWVTPVVDAPYHGVVTYTVILSNTGALSDTAAILTDTLPAGTDFGGWLENPGAVVVNDVITWTGTLTNQTTLTFTFTAMHTGKHGDVITNTAYFSGTAQIDSKAAVFSVVAPEIAVLGNNQVIAAGDTMPSTADHTDFGGVALGRAITRTFTISNTGTADLTLTGTPAVSLTGIGAGDFNMVAQPDTPVGSNTTTTFRVRFTPSVTGTRVATVTIANNDRDENPYDFVIQGLGTAATGVTFYLPLILRNAEP